MAGRFSKVIWGVLLGAFIILLVRWFSQPPAEPTISLSGTTMGPILYSVKYLDPAQRNFQTQVDSVLIAFNNSLSTYIPESEISRLNSGNAVTFESPYLAKVLEQSQEVYELTKGAFDPTVGPLVNGWGFGPGHDQNLLDSATVDSLMSLVGFEKIQFDDESASKTDALVYLDFSAIAKGYGVDVVGEFLEAKGVKAYMVEIGGEVRCRGKNARERNWLIGIDDPNVEQAQRKLKAKVYLEDRSLATSGNYRNFYVKDGQKISHTISPFTGFPVEHSLLSASVFASDCMTADALATGFMVMGYEPSLEILETLENVEAFLIYDEAGVIKTYATEGIRNYLEVE